MPDVPPPNWPYYELPSTELAAWLDGQPDMWWMVDGDPLLTGRLSFPCPSDELAAELRELNRPLLIRAKLPDATGQPIERDKIDGLGAWYFGPCYPSGEPRPTGKNDRVFEFRWKDRPAEWLLIEDSVEAERAKAEWAEAARTGPAPGAR